MESMKLKINIVYIITSPAPYGANKALLNILDGMVERGVRPLVVMALKGDMCEELEARNIQYQIVEHYFSIYPPLCSIRDGLLFFPRFLRTFWYNDQAIKKINYIVKEFKPDIIHTNIGPDHVGFQVAKKLDIPHVWHIREYQDLDFGWHPFPSKRKFLRKLYDTNNYPIAITYSLFNHYSLQSNACVIYDGVMQKSHTQFIAKKEKYFLFVGRLEDAKGISMLVEAYIEFCKFDNDTELRIAGDGDSSYETKLHQMVDDAQLTQRIRFLGFRTDISNLMANATALVVSSRYEGFGFITVEAMFNGCLVIGNNSGGTKEIMQKENLGLLYSRHDELVDTMKAIVSKGIESYYPMIIKAQERAVALYSVEQNVSAVYNFYQEILEKKQIKEVCGF
jgi:glycosyltransferase involved in cell wall biosynthesis